MSREVEQALAGVNNVFGLTSEQLESFAQNLFVIARTSNRSFVEAVEEARQLSREGWTLPQTLERLLEKPPSSG